MPDSRRRLDGTAGTPVQDEPLTPGIAVATAVVLAGIALVNARRG
jgi:hypothetical protein